MRSAAITIPRPTADETDVIQRRTVRILVLSQVFGGAGLGAGIAVGALLAEDMLGSTSLAGLPSALFALGAAAAALLVGRLSQRDGRRLGLVAGYTGSLIGSIIVVLSAVISNPALLMLGLFLYGAGSATNLQARYAGTDLVAASRRGRAVSTVLVATTLGAVIGPNLVDVMGRFAGTIGIPALGGPFILAGAAYAVAATILHVFLRPDPLLTARAIAPAPPIPSAEATARSTEFTPWSGNLRLGALTMIITQVVMVGIMTMTPIHMRDNGHGLADTGLVISIHIASMYLPSPLSGWLADRFGRRPVIVAAGLVLLSAGVVAATAPVDSIAMLALALGLLGLGWNLGLISGTTLVTDGTPLASRARTQGSVDLAVALAGSGGGILSGIVVNATSYTALALAGGLLALMLVPLMLRGGAVRSAPATG
ncbi:MAG: Uncharacterized MFS-type transporter [uncultured Thermomicrobiales bacterium]|uniref:Uncharacterized MFS-type transporter n=1 Tax=uncultured Thermomicrobiales bacterium TaxID=1645740 RepID=A0A6J4VIN9_9BACT|nr:MAG: Uncharacterized MFS-type transporter [uncultured Thermomicrobiales bacterium]